MGIPFKRLLLAGVGGGIVYTFTKIVISDWSIPLAVLAAVVFILLTSPQGGIPRWQRVLYALRGGLMLQAAQQPESMPGNAARLLELPADLTTLDASIIFATPALFMEANLSEWVTFARTADADHDDGLVFIDTPLEVK